MQSRLKADFEVLWDEFEELHEAMNVALGLFQRGEITKPEYLHQTYISLAEIGKRIVIAKIIKTGD